MIIYRCTECGGDIAGSVDGVPARIRWEMTNCVGYTAHFCSLQCASDWADDAGYRDTVID